MSDRLKRLQKLVVDLEIEQVPPQLEGSLEAGEEPEALLQAMTQGMTQVGELFDEGTYFLADLVLAGQLMKEGLAVLQPHFSKERSALRGTVILGTVKGDVHDIGKNVVGNMLSSAGFQVVDLGVDVPAARVVEAVRAHTGSAVGLSVLLTPMVESVTEVVSALRAAGLRQSTKIAIGGACTTAAVMERTGVDALGRSPTEAVKIFGEFFQDE